LKHYKRVALINHGAGDVEFGRAHAKEFAAVFNLTYAEIPGDLEYFRRLLVGPWDASDFLRLEPGQSFTAQPFLALHAISLP
jgi:hypothetical protein